MLWQRDGADGEGGGQREALMCQAEKRRGLRMDSEWEGMKF